MLNLSSRMVIFLRILRIVILIRIFRLASQKEQLEKVTRRMVSWPLNISRLLISSFQLFVQAASVVSSKTYHGLLVCSC